MTNTDTAQLVVDLQATDEAVRANGWVAPGLGVPGAPLDLLGSTLNPLTGLATAGLGWFMPLVSFLGDGLTQLQGGNAASVSSGAQDFGAAGQDITDVADSYRASTSAQTSGWSGSSATEYRNAAAQHAEGVTGLGQASNTTASAIIGAGQVVAQAIAEITQLISEAVAEIVPIMTQAVARAGETFGQSVAEAIPPCVGIAVTYAAKIAAKLAALMASGDNLMKLVQGGMAVVELIQSAMSSISQQSASAAAEPQAAAGAGVGGGGAEPPQVGGPESTMAASDSGSGGSGSGSGSPSQSSAGGYGAAPTPGTSSDGGTRSSGVVPPVSSAVPDTARAAGGGPVSTGAGVPMGAAGLAQGGQTGAGRGADTARQDGKQQPARTSSGSGGVAPGGLPMGGARPGGDTDKEHQRKYGLDESHEEDLEYAPEVIHSGKPGN
jgi:uncharacterized protein YukE